MRKQSERSHCSEEAHTVFLKDKQLLNKLSLNKPLCEWVNSSSLCSFAITFLRDSPFLPPSRDTAAYASGGGRRKELEKHSLQGRAGSSSPGEGLLHCAATFWAVAESPRDFTGVSLTRRPHPPLSSLSITQISCLSQPFVRPLSLPAERFKGFSSPSQKW